MIVTRRSVDGGELETCLPSLRIIIAGPSIPSQGLQLLLLKAFSVEGVITSKSQLLAHLSTRKPDVLLMDSDFGAPFANEPYNSIRTAAHYTQVLLLSQQADRFAMRNAFQSGCEGFMLKQQAPGELFTALRSVAKGHQYCAPELRHHLPWAQRVTSAWKKASESGMTPRQVQVLQYIAEGRTNRDMAGLLALSVKTVEYHRALLMQQTGLRTVAELVRHAMQHGLIEPQAATTNETTSNGTSKR